MFHNFSGQTADEVWLQAAAALTDSSECADSPLVSAQASRAGSTSEILHVALSIADPRQRWVASRTPPINPAFAIAEVIWMLSGRNDSRLPNYFNRELPKFAGQSETYHGAYGHRLRAHLGIDQLDRAHLALQGNADSRQVVLQLWDGRCDLPLADGQPQAPDIPCNVLSMLKVRGGALEWTQILRSNDLFRGVPYNFVQFTTLQEIVAGWLGVAVGSYNHLSDSLHVYDRDAAEVAATTPSESAVNRDVLALPREESQRVFNELGRIADKIADEDVPATVLKAIAHRTLLPSAYRNLLAVLCAEGARRRKATDEMREILALCGNQCLAALFTRWADRWPSKTIVALPDLGLP